jgi:hypothetical protein
VLDDVELDEPGALEQQVMTAIISANEAEILTLNNTFLSILLTPPSFKIFLKDD